MHRYNRAAPACLPASAATQLQTPCYLSTLMSALQNDKRQLETALVVEGTQAAAIKRAASSAPRPPARPMPARLAACLPT